MDFSKPVVALIPTSGLVLSTKAPAQEFLKFSGLPIEVRLMIWEMALPGPRMVNVGPRMLMIRYCTRVWSGKANDVAGNKRFFDWEKASGIPWNEYGPHVEINSDSALNSIHAGAPGLFSSCSEAFHVAAASYIRILGHVRGVTDVWFNPRIDTLRLNEILLHYWSESGGNGYYDQMTLGSGLEVVQNLAIDLGSCNNPDVGAYLRPVESSWFGNRDTWKKMCRILRAFGHVKNLVFTLGLYHHKSHASPNGSHDLLGKFADDDGQNLVFTEMQPVGLYVSGSSSHRYMLLQNPWPYEAKHFSDTSADTYHLQAQKDDDIRRGDLHPWQTPTISHKIVTTPQILNWLEKEKRAHEVQRLAHREKITIHVQLYLAPDPTPPGFDFVVVTEVSHDTTIARIRKRVRDKVLFRPSRFVDNLEDQREIQLFASDVNTKYFIYDNRRGHAQIPVQLADDTVVLDPSLFLWDEGLRVEVRKGDAAVH